MWPELQQRVSPRLSQCFIFLLSALQQSGSLAGSWLSRVRPSFLKKEVDMSILTSKIIHLPRTLYFSEILFFFLNTVKLNSRKWLAFKVSVRMARRVSRGRFTELKHLSGLWNLFFCVQWAGPEPKVS